MEKYQSTEHEDYYRTLLGLCHSVDHTDFIEYYYKDWRICQHILGQWANDKNGIQEMYKDQDDIMIESESSEGFTAEYVITYIDEHTR